MTEPGDAASGTSITEVARASGLGSGGAGTGLESDAAWRHSWRHRFLTWADRHYSKPTVIGRLTHWLFARHPRVVSWIFFGVGSVGFGYLWAVVFGHGLHGMESSSQMDRTGEWPNADIAFIAALALATLGTLRSFIQLAHRFPWLTGWRARLLLLVCPCSGLVLFGISRIFI